MSKKQLCKEILPIVCIGFQDHSANLEGQAEPYIFLAIGVVLKEDALGYLIGHWLQQSPKVPLDEIGDVTTYIAKVKGLTIKTVGHVKVTG